MSFGAVYITFGELGAYVIHASPETPKVVGKCVTARHKAAISCAILHTEALDDLPKRIETTVEFIEYKLSAEPELLAFDQVINLPGRQSVAKQVFAEAEGLQTA